VESNAQGGKGRKAPRPSLPWLAWKVDPAAVHHHSEERGALDTESVVAFIIFDRSSLTAIHQ